VEKGWCFSRETVIQGVVAEKSSGAEADVLQPRQRGSARGSCGHCTPEPITGFSWAPPCASPVTSP